MTIVELFDAGSNNSAIVDKPGRAHTVRNETGAEVRAYVVFSPGAGMEAFVRAAADAPGDVRALAGRHGIEVTNLAV